MKFGVYQDNQHFPVDLAEIQMLASGIAETQRSQVRHEPISSPDHRNPFIDRDAEGEYWRALGQVVDDSVIPAGYGLFADEWEDGVYPVIEKIKVGWRAGKIWEISLAEPIWQHRSVLWAQGLNLLTRVVQ